ncbi:MAG: PIN domain-containing protein [Candidatus Aminicenantes bacterium]|nr:PIN domain-containing protein [Candidatus Aminicenantes bacterium]NIM84571.1 PIN domain-containing protein [Candidatus Aminicenantes bacterium]NIN24092.1 PIN domain-containing protein [Candidatus Aminicenantes bacterium]NIN47798.1 PIN domain-containing protein [Candidatus Aminicenantes bacterium]NIN90736.1 PIN domain-containing protein [Candidatus Aminicenantes bacterium]
MNYFLDTHVVVWLYQKSLKLLSPKAIQAIEDNSISISPIVLLELEYLYEIGKIKTDSHTILKYLKKKIGLKLDRSNFFKIINAALKEKWTRDPFDRIIVAHSKFRDTYLVTKDENISKHYSKIII